MNKVKKRQMLDYMPKYYPEIKEVDNLIEREADEIVKLDTSIKDVLDQFFIDIATWGLALWERVYGIKPDTTRPLSRRRAELRAKVRGHVPTTKEQLQNTLETFDERLSFTENFGDYSITVNIPYDAIENKNVYYSVKDFRVGYPFAEFLNEPLVDLGELLRMLKTVLPAHIALAFFYITSAESGVTIDNGGKANITGYHTVSDFKIGDSFVAYRREEGI
ncbi:MAG TPA: DUF2313 domain-containing protein [Clostridiaceae bacterium]|nr:DUF2313 domain-containing protein [Clostridiaceae bacterium]